MTKDFRTTEQQRALRWKRTTDTLPEAARAAAPFGPTGRTAYSFCLPAGFADHNLLPEVRGTGLALFQELGIPWHQGIGDGPGNHLLSSQVQCVNALGQMTGDPERVRRAFGGVLDVTQVLEIEPGRFLTFEWIGSTDVFGEAPNGLRVRGSRCTSVDAAFLYRTSSGTTELALVEWKYTEQYLTPRPLQPAKDETRRRRYEAAWLAADGPLRTDVLSFAQMLDEPFYQLMRQQLLAWEAEKTRELDADVVRVVHVCPPANEAYQQSLVRQSHRDSGETVDEVWRRLLSKPDRFVKLDPSVFLEPEVTSREYIVRYG